MARSKNGHKKDGFKTVPNPSHNSFDVDDSENLINYLALAAAILDEKYRPIDYYLKGLYNKDEAEARMKEIDKIRASVGQTELEEEKAQKKIACNGMYTRQIRHRNIRHTFR